MSIVGYSQYKRVIRVHLQGEHYVPLLPVKKMKITEFKPAFEVKLGFRLLAQDASQS
jgi:hypothetical protein